MHMRNTCEQLRYSELIKSCEKQQKQQLKTKWIRWSEQEEAAFSISLSIHFTNEPLLFVWVCVCVCYQVIQHTADMRLENETDLQT